MKRDESAADDAYVVAQEKRADSCGDDAAGKEGLADLLCVERERERERERGREGEREREREGVRPCVQLWFVYHTHYVCVCIYVCMHACIYVKCASCVCVCGESGLCTLAVTLNVFITCSVPSSVLPSCSPTPV